jgi:SAM-dependent methyltransferase
VLRVPEPGQVRFGDLRRLTPLSRDFGSDRGLPLDRHYVESFLTQHSADIRGHVLEIGESTYTRRFGGAQVTKSDVLFVREGNPHATIVADLAHAPEIPDASFDTLVITQTLHLIYDARAAVRTMHRILKPGGTLLLTVPYITQVPYGTEWAHTWYWAFSQLAVQRMLAEEFGAAQVTITDYGNVLAASAMLYGLSAQDLTREELDTRDPDYPVIIGARVVRAP